MQCTSNIRFLRPLLAAATLTLSLPGYAVAPSQSDATADATSGTAADARPPRRNNQFPISVADLEARATAAFTSLDGNGDGVIDPEEFEANELERGASGRGARDGFGPPGSPHMKGDRHSPKMEGSDRAARHEEMEAKLFEALDKDADGALSPAEFAELQDARKSLMKQSAFARLDANHDGVLDKDEFPPRRLANLDVNGDGEISRDEMRSQRHKKQQPAG